MKSTKGSAPVKKVKGTLGQRPPGMPVTPPGVTEGFRRARSSISGITADLQQLRRRAASAVKGAQRPAKSK